MGTTAARILTLNEHCTMPEVLTRGRNGLNDLPDKLQDLSCPRSMLSYLQDRQRVERVAVLVHHGLIDRCRGIHRTESTM